MIGVGLNRTIPCPACRGEGGEFVTTCNHGGQNCPCPAHWIDCPDCDGSGQEACHSCGQVPAAIRTEWGPFCIACAEEEQQANQEETRCVA